MPYGRWRAAGGVITTGRTRRDWFGWTGYSGIGDPEGPEAPVAEVGVEERRDPGAVVVERLVVVAALVDAARVTFMVDSPSIEPARGPVNPDHRTLWRPTVRGLRGACECLVRVRCDDCHRSDGGDSRGRGLRVPTRPTRGDLGKFLPNGGAAARHRRARWVGRAAPDPAAAPKPLVNRHIRRRRRLVSPVDGRIRARRHGSLASYTLGKRLLEPGVGLAFVSQRGYGRPRWLVV
jgi:hypothetical protein